MEDAAILEEKLSRLRHDYSEQEKNLTRAAEIGKSLLDENTKMEERMQAQAKDHRKDIELLEQEKYTLQRNLERKLRMECDYVEEIEGLKQSLQQIRDQMSIKQEAEYQLEVSKLKNQVCQQQADLDRLNLGEKQLRERNSELENQVEETRQQLQQKVNLLNETCSEEIAQLHNEVSNLQGEKILQGFKRVNFEERIVQICNQVEETRQQLHQKVNLLNETCSEENAQLHNEVSHLQGEKLALLRELGDNKDQVQQLLLSVNSAREQLAFKDNDIEERACQATSYYNALEKSREENQELRAELDMLRLESQDQKTKGNSLFSEVEDRRVVAEKQLITMKVEYESLRKQYEASRQNHCRLRMQLAGLLQSSSGRTDAEHLNSLQQQLSQKNEEVHSLMGKLHKYEKQGSCSETMEDIQKMLGADKMDKNYVGYLQSLTEQKQKEMSKLQEEIRTKSLQLLAESDKLMQCESKLYTKQREVEMYRGQNMKLSVEVEELRLKYEPDKLKTTKKIRKTVREQIPLSKSEQEKLAKTEDIQPPKLSTEHSKHSRNDDLNQEELQERLISSKLKEQPLKMINKQQRNSQSSLKSDAKIEEIVSNNAGKTSSDKDLPTVFVEEMETNDDKTGDKDKPEPSSKDINKTDCTSQIKSSLKTKTDVPRVSVDKQNVKVPLVSQTVSNLPSSTDDTHLSDTHFSKSMKKRKVTISDENQIVEPESPVYDDDNSNEATNEGATETKGRLRGRIQCQKTVQVPRASTKLGEDPNECKNQ